jgi:putative tricarboxylic transport membrane protein
VVLSVAQLAKCLRETPEAEASWGGLDWGRVALLTVAMIIYATLFPWLGFMVATALFLVTGFLILGERRPLILFVASVPVAVGFWAIMTQLLGLYLAPGEAYRGWLY